MLGKNIFFLCMVLSPRDSLIIARRMVNFEELFWSVWLNLIVFLGNCIKHALMQGFSLVFFGLVRYQSYPFVLLVS